MSADNTPSETDLQRLQAAIEVHLENIEKILPRYNLALVANHKTRTDGESDILFSLSSRERILQAVDKFLPAPKGGDARVPEARLLALLAYYRSGCVGTHPYHDPKAKKQDSAKIMDGIGADIEAVCAEVEGDNAEAKAQANE